jgi:PKD repeat protein
MRWSHRWLFFALALLLPLAASTASAQYMYLDSNGDGVNTAADVMAPNGTPTTVDVWLHTNMDKTDGAEVCNTEDAPLDLGAYVIILQATNGAVTYGTFTNQAPFASIAANFGPLLSPDGRSFMRGVGGPAGQNLTPGLYRIATFIVTGSSGSPSLAIIDNFQETSEVTNFGTSCDGNDFDSTYKLIGPTGIGTDWEDVDGLGAAAGGNAAPVLGAIGNRTTNEGVQLSFTATATDADAGDVLTFTLGAGAPAGAAITSGGAFTWTPTEAQGPGIFQVTVNVSDGTDTDSETIDIQVAEVNVAPELAAIGNRTTAEGSNLTFVATATDADLPANTLTFTLGAGAPAGASITSGGTFNWTPTEEQGPGTHPITVIVTDNGTPTLNDTETIQVTVTEANQAPVLAPIGDKNAQVNVQLAFTATATDADLPPQTLTFSLGAGAPAGAAITAGGDFTWTPTASGTFPITIQVSDGTASGSETINVTVSDSPNAPPVLAAIGDRSVNELELLSFTATATDTDGDPVTFSLGAGAPTGAAITAGGDFTWTPTEAQGPGVFPVTVIVSDGTIEDSETIDVTVNEVNVAPVLAPIGDQSGAVGVPVTFDANATDADLPANTLTFSLDAGAPAGATIDPATGEFSWTPTASGSFPVTVVVTDNGTPSLSDSEAITITVSADNAPPVLDAIGNKTVDEGSLLAFTATANDTDGDPITFSLGAGAPDGAAITAGGDFTWTPTEAQGPGVFSIIVIASDGTLQDSETIDVTVNELNIAPVLDPIGDRTVDEGTLLSFNATATDADLPANPLIFTLGAGAPAGAAITTGGAFSWTPSETDGPGVYPITIEVSDGTVPDSETINVTVNEVNQDPALAAIGNQTGTVGTAVTFTASATDADIPTNEMTFSLDAGAPAGATIDPVTGAFSFTPTSPGVFQVTVRVTDNGSPTGEDFETISISVDQTNEAPVLDQPSDMTVNEGETATQQLTATDPNGDTLTFEKVDGPDFMTVSASGLITLSPGFDDAGTYPARVRVSDGSLTDEADFNITVNAQNQAPTADAGGPYTGTLSAPVNFDGSGSSDPDGDPLTYDWDFGDGQTGTGVTTQHTYAAEGTYTVTLTVSDGALTDEDITTATIVDTFGANAFFVGGNKSTKLGSGKPTTCANVEPVDESFEITDVDLTSITMTYSGQSITAIADKTVVNSDKNGNGVNEIVACFSKDDLRTLFAGLGPGQHEVTITIEGDLVSGGSFSATTTHSVVGTNRTFTAIASPNPLNPSTKLEFKTSQAGRVTVQVYDLQGRLVKTLQDGTMPAGYNTVHWDGSTGNGTKVSSGMYYLRVKATEGETVVRVAVVK